MDLQQLRDDAAAWKVLEERARDLALQDVASADVLGEEVLIFRLGDGGYSLPARSVHEVQPFENYTPLPAVPSFVIGLVNIRGRLLSAIDIRPLLDIAVRPPDAAAFLLIVGAAGMEVGLLADSVTEVAQGDAELAPALSTTAGRGVAWIQGVDRHHNLVLDPNSLLTDPRLLVNTSAETV